mgnify:CR=1 FL=1
MIVTCDDFGIHRDIDLSIISLCKAKKINAVSIISCGKTFSSSIKELIDIKGKVDLGIHATWVGERSIINYQKISSITTHMNALNDDFKIFYLKWSLGIIKLEHLRIELEEQILRLLNIVGKIDHIDSHQHIHMIPQIFELCIKLAEKYDIPRIRIVNEDCPTGIPKPFNLIKFFGGRLITSWAIKNKKRAEINLIKSTKSFFGFMHSGNYNLIENHVTNFLKENRSKDVEINFHPAFQTDSLKKKYPWYRNGEFDYNLLLNS